MGNQTPRPRAIARRLVLVCEKLWQQGDIALREAREQQSPLRARSYSVDGKLGSSARPQESGDDDAGYDDQTGDVACSRVNRVTLYDQMCSAMTGLETAAIKVDNLFERIVGKAKHSEAQRKTRQQGSGHCIACGDWMPGTAKHRIKSGFCPTHNTGFHEARRKQGITRDAYITKMRQKYGYDGRAEE